AFAECLQRSLKTVTSLISASFFFFQAEDGIRDKLVTGVQTCALPISRRPRTAAPRLRSANRRSPRSRARRPRTIAHGDTRARSRSEERRVGKECRTRWSADH